MSHLQFLAFRKFKTLGLLAALGAVLFRAISLSTTIAQSPAERKLTAKTFKEMPLAIHRVRNLEKAQDWFRDLQIEVKNVSDKPIYFISVGQRCAGRAGRPLGLGCVSGQRSIVSSVRNNLGK
jgi:hypothetical protein